MKAAVSAVPTTNEQASELLVALTKLVRDLRRVVPTDEHVARITADYGLAPRHISVLIVIAVLGPLSVGELAAREGIALSTASLLVTQLADAGLVDRSEDPIDRRRTVVSVATSHEARSRDLIEARLAPLNRALTKIGTRNAKVVVDAMAAIADELAATDPIEIPGVLR